MMTNQSPDRITDQSSMLDVKTAPHKAQNTCAHAGLIKTQWELRTYDVWGNNKDGYEVNDSFNAGTVILRIPQTRYNIGTPYEFLAAFPPDRQIKRTFGVRCQIDIKGHDLHVYVTRSRDGYPIGEMFCESHESLSPVKALEGFEFEE